MRKALCCVDEEWRGVRGRLTEGSLEVTRLIDDVRSFSIGRSANGAKNALKLVGGIPLRRGACLGISCERSLLLTSGIDSGQNLFFLV
jgi:hypothetical protein